MVRIFLCMFLALFSLAASAMEAQVENAGTSVTISDKACPVEIVALFAADPRTAVQAAQADKALHEALYRDASGQVRGCWMAAPNDQVFLRYEDGDAGLIPTSAFKAVESY